VLAVVLEEDSVGFGVSEYLLMHPIRTNNLLLFGVLSTGDLIHIGKVEIDETRATLRLQAVNTIYSLALDLEAVYTLEDQTLTFMKADINTNFLPSQEHPRVLQPD
jgi:hypothetical protein